jgi:hypothetical protein
MGSRYRNHRYITDGIIYNTFVFDENGNNRRVSELYEIWARPKSTRKFDHLLSYDNGYVVNTVTDVRVCGDMEMVALHTRAGRQIRTPLDASVVTPEGPVRVRDLGMEQQITVVDNYKNYYGDKVALRTHGNARLRAFLRNHMVHFTINEFDGTVTDRGTLYCQDYDTPMVTWHHNVYTFGLNNYREAIKDMFALPDFAYDEVVKVVKAMPKYAIAIYVNGPQNVVLPSGIIVQSTQTEVQSDW